MNVGSWVTSTPALKYTMNGVDGEMPSCRLSRIARGASATPLCIDGTAVVGIETCTPVVVELSATSTNDDGNGVRHSSPTSGLQPVGTSGGLLDEHAAAISRGT